MLFSIQGSLSFYVHDANQFKEYLSNTYYLFKTLIYDFLGLLFPFTSYLRDQD